MTRGAGVSGCGPQDGVIPLNLEQGVRAFGDWAGEIVGEPVTEGETIGRLLVGSRSAGGRFLLPGFTRGGRHDCLFSER